VTAILVHGVPDTDQVWHAVLPRLGRPDLDRLRAPGLVLWGERDPYAPPTWGERLARRTNARLVTFAGCSHWWPLERPAEVAALLTRHWDELGR
jgi:pimeloyl-ACP methyl ester carboxylesterase